MSNRTSLAIETHSRADVRLIISRIRSTLIPNSPGLNDQFIYSNSISIILQNIEYCVFGKAMRRYRYLSDKDQVTLACFARPPRTARHRDVSIRSNEVLNPHCCACHINSLQPHQLWRSGGGNRRTGHSTTRIWRSSCKKFYALGCLN